MTPSDLSLDDLEESKITVILFHVNCVKNGKSYDVGPMVFTLDDPDRLKVKVTIF